MSEDLISMLTSIGLTPTVIDETGVKQVYQASLAPERARARAYAGTHRFYSIAFLAPDRKTWKYILGAEVLYFQDGSSFLQIPSRKDFEIGKVLRPGLTEHHIFTKFCRSEEHTSELQSH